MSPNKTDVIIASVILGLVLTAIIAGAILLCRKYRTTECTSTTKHDDDLGEPIDYLRLRHNDTESDIEV